MQLYSSDVFVWRGNLGSAYLSDLPASNPPLRGFPQHGFNVKSVKTGRWLTFLYDNETMEAHEFFDGEASVYVCDGFSITLRH